MEKPTIAIVYATDWTQWGDTQVLHSDAVAMKPVHARIIGHLIKRDDECITVAAQLFDNSGLGENGLRHVVTIPNQCVSKVILMDEPDDG